MLISQIPLLLLLHNDLLLNLATIPTTGVTTTPTTLDPIEANVEAS